MLRSASLLLTWCLSDSDVLTVGLRVELKLRRLVWLGMLPMLQQHWPASNLSGSSSVTDTPVDSAAMHRSCRLTRSWQHCGDATGSNKRSYWADTLQPIRQNASCTPISTIFSEGTKFCFPSHAVGLKLRCRAEVLFISACDVVNNQLRQCREKTVKSTEPCRRRSES